MQSGFDCTEMVSSISWLVVINTIIIIVQTDDKYLVMTPWFFFLVCPLLSKYRYAKWPFGLVSEKTAVHCNYVYPPT